MQRRALVATQLLLRNITLQCRVDNTAFCHPVSSNHNHARIIQTQRRQFVKAIGGLAACAGSRQLFGAEEPYGAVIPGEETWSESLMLLHFDEALSNGISVRVSRYPDKNVTWVWCHVLFEGRMYSFTERRPAAPAPGDSVRRCRLPGRRRASRVAAIKRCA